MRRRNPLLLTAVLSLALAGCVPTSEVPLSDPATAKVDPKLCGAWVPLNDDKDTTVCFIGKSSDEKAPEGRMVYCEARVDAKGVARLPNAKDVAQFFTTHLDGHNYANVLPEKGNSGYTILKYSIAGDRLLAWELANEALIAAIEKKTLRGMVTRGTTTTVRITDTRENLVRFLKDNDRQCFPPNKQTEFRRLKK